MGTSPVSLASPGAAGGLRGRHTPLRAPGSTRRGTPGGRGSIRGVQGRGGRGTPGAGGRAGIDAGGASPGMNGGRGMAGVVHGGMVREQEEGRRQRWAEVGLSDSDFRFQIHVHIFSVLVAQTYIQIYTLRSDT